VNTISSASSARPRASLARRLTSESAVYGLGGVANQAIAIILVPIYVRSLGADYGTVAILSTTISLATLVVTLALPQAFFRSYLKEADDERERASVLRAAFGLRLVVSLIGLAMMAALAVPASLLILGSDREWPLMALIGPVVFLDSLNLIPLSFLRGERRPVPYAVLSFTRAALGSALIVLFVVVFPFGVIGVLLGSLASSLVTTIAGLVFLARNARLSISFDGRLARHMLAFSLPLVPASLAGWTLNVSDRYIVNAVQGRDAVGLYSAGYTLGLAMNALAVAPFTLAWGAAYWEIAKQAAAPRVISRVGMGFTAVACFVALGVSALATDAIRILLTPQFEPSRFVTPFSAFAYVAYGMYAIASTGLNLEGRTRWLPLVVGAGAALNVTLNLLLIPRIGYIGAAVSTLVSYSVLPIASGIVSQRYYPVPWPIGRIGFTVALALALSAAALIGPDQLLWRMGCVAAFPALLMVLHIVSLDTLRTLARTTGP
jgi:O-antigen/teichoic acid export membrane protein